MCFPPEASFATAATLVPVGCWCPDTANKCLPKFRGFALIPIGLGLQQFAVGLVWVGLERKVKYLVLIGSSTYRFTALVFWPLWYSIASALVETSINRRKVMFLWLLGLILLVVVYMPVLFNSSEKLTACHCSDSSIRYPYSDKGIIQPPFSNLQYH